MSLSECSADVYAQIFFFLPGADLTVLAASSKPLFHSVFGRGLLTSWRQVLERRLWPSRQLYETATLKDLSLTVYRPALAKYSLAGIPHPLSFGKQLQTLKIFGEGALSLFFNQPTRELPILPTTKINDPNGHPHAWVNLGELLPQLVTLCIIESDDLISTTALPDTLPRSLTSLRVESPLYSGKRINLPLKLEEMTNLTHLRINPLSVVSNQAHLEAQLAQLTNLTSLHIRDLPLNTVIPSRLTSLTIDTVTSDQHKVLQKCRKLRHTSYYQLAPDLLLLPTLTSLEAAIGTDLVAFAKALPPTLTKFRMGSCYDHDRQVWKLAFLPESLLHFWAFSSFTLGSVETTKAKIEELRQAGENVHHLLPPRLLTLQFFSEGLDPEWWPLLPSSIRFGHLHLRIPEQASTSPDQDLNFRKAFPDYSGDLSLVPSNRKAPIQTNWTFPHQTKYMTLRLPTPAADTSSPLLLNLPQDRWPSSLRALRVLWQPEFPATLPPLQMLSESLKTLIIEEATDYSHTRADSLIIADFVASFATLPLYLTTLQICTSRVFDHPGDLLKVLPQTLTDIECKTLRHFDDNTVPLLPPKLKRLCLRHGQKLSDTGVAMMPKTLETLEIKLNREITHRSLRIFSPFLVLLNLPKNALFTKTFKEEIIQILKERIMTVQITTKMMKGIFY